MALPEELIPVNRNDSNIPVVCPYLGTMPDPHTSVAYPSGANFCHRTDNPQLVSPAHQGQVCLLEAYDNCATYRDALIPVKSIDVGGPVKKKSNWKRPLAIVAVILLFGVVLFGAYAMFSPFSTEPVDASAPSIQDSEETALASISVPTPTLIAVSTEDVSGEDVSEVIDVDAITTDAAQTDTIAEEAEEIEAPPTAAENENEIDASSEEAKKAPISQTPAPTAIPDLKEDTAFFDFDDIDAFDSADEFASATEPSSIAEETAAETVEPTPAANTDIADGTAVIRTGALNVRSGPGPQFPSIALAYNGQHVILLGRNGDNSWVKVRLLNGPVGWIYAAHIEPGQPLDEIPFIPRAQR